MPREARVTSSIGVYHTILRGVKKQQIFECTEDYEHFVRILQRQCGLPVDTRPSSYNGRRNVELPHLKKGVMIGVGAAFKFNSGTGEKYAPLWIRKHHLEFVYRICQDPKKQLNRCWWIVRTLPSMYREEKAKKRAADRYRMALIDLKDAERQDDSAKAAQCQMVIDATRVIENEYWKA